jgi:hypothetical protein
VRIWGLRPFMWASLDEARFHYRNIFKTDINRFEMSCPECQQGCNSKALGGTEKCFHCDVCGLLECEVTSPSLEELRNGAESREGLPDV